MLLAKWPHVIVNNIPVIYNKFSLFFEVLFSRRWIFLSFNRCLCQILALVMTLLTYESNNNIFFDFIIAIC